VTPALVRSLFVNKTDRYGLDVNSHDWIKFLAILIMTVDHIGFFLMPDQLWLRAVGRWMSPAWFFLVGYSPARAFPAPLILFAVFMLIANALTAVPVFPLNALVSVMVCRFAISLFERHDAFARKYLLDIFTACLLFLLPTYWLYEYGTLAILFAIMGYLCRTGPRDLSYTAFVAGTFTVFVAFQIYFYGFNLAESLIVIAGTAACVNYLFSFERKSLFSGADTKIGKLIVKFLSRNSLYYYFFHRLFLQIIGVFTVISPEKYKIYWF